MFSIGSSKLKTLFLVSLFIFAILVLNSMSRPNNTDLIQKLNDNILTKNSLSQPKRPDVYKPPVQQEANLEQEKTTQSVQKIINYKPNTNRVKKHQLCSEAKQTNKWIVVTSVHKPNADIKILANQKGFQLVVTGDKKTPKDWSFPGVIFLSVETQKALGFQTYDSLPFGNYQRKNIGYLFAISCGAEYIYDTDDDNHPYIDASVYFNMKDHDYGLILNSTTSNSSAWNPCTHFGQPNMWPRGYPLSQINKPYINDYVCTRRKTSWVQQGVVDGDPDVDAIFRLTKSMESKPINVTFDPSAPSMQIPPFRFAPYNAQNTFFWKEAFWSLYLPVTHTFRVTDIWRSYWTQRLIWLLDGTIQFYGPNAFQQRNSHSYLSDYKEEPVLYMQTEALLEFLTKWKCSKDLFYECVIDLTQQMADNNFWGQEDVVGVQNWLSDLDSIGYVQPTIVKFENIKTKEIPSSFRVRFTPKFQDDLDFINYFSDKNTEQMIHVHSKYQDLKYFENFCGSQIKLNANTTSLETNKNKKDIVLVVMLNSIPKEENMLLIKHSYDSYFQNIVMCGPGANLYMQNHQKKNLKKFDSFTLIDSGFSKSEIDLKYNCMTKAYEMNFITKGYLAMNEDVLLKHWQLNKLSTEKIWFPSSLTCDQSTEDSALTNAFKELNEKKDQFCIAEANVFYIPIAKLKKFQIMSKVFLKNQVQSKHAVANILKNIEKENSIEVIKGLEDKEFSMLNYSNATYYAYPSKISSYLSSQSNAKLYCEGFVKDKITNGF